MDQQTPQIRAIFEEVIEAPPESREALLQARCGNDVDLRRRVEALIAAAESDDSFLADPTHHRADAAARPTIVLAASNEPVGSFIGPYKLLELIGEGGFGSVYVAEQEKPVRRRVALKVIKLGMDTKQVIARFEAERQALAMMDHPNIARVLDAGATESGRPWFAMELVRGVPITEYCDAANLTAAERLELFTQVCHAVQHAHQKGVIHRDIKPSNVLVTLHDGKPVPKVIDFGIAKAVGAQLTDKTVYTLHRQMIGTPAYMSPEQAEMSGLDVDTRADVYSLGVLLYELLTGSPPFAVEDLMKAGMAEMQRIIREVEPVKPSTRVNTLGDTLPTVAAHRRVEPKRLGVMLRGDLDWIAMKCLEKDRSRRYGTANDLAADVQRHLTGEPVIAAPPSAAYRLRKFVRKHRTGVMAGSAMAAALILGVIGTGAGMAIAKTKQREAVAARGEERRQREAAEVAKREAEAAQQEAEFRRAEVERSAYIANVTAAANDSYNARRHLDACPEHLRGWEWRYLDSISDTSTNIVEYPDGMDDWPLMSSDGQRCFGYTHGNEKETASIQVLDTDTGRLLRTLNAAGRYLRYWAISDDGSRIAMRTEAGIEIWETVSGRRLSSLKDADHFGIIFSPDCTQLLMTKPPATLQLWDVGSATPIAELTSTSIANSSEPPRKFSSYSWSASNRRVHSTCFYAWSSDGSHVLANWHECGTAVFDASTGERLAVLSGQSDRVWAGDFSPDGSRVVLATNNQVGIWDVTTGTLVAEHPGQSVHSTVFSPDGSKVLTVSYLGGGYILNVDTWKPLWAFESLGASKGVFCPDGMRVLIMDNWLAYLRDVESGSIVAELRGHREGIDRAAFSADGTRIVTMSDQDRTIRVWDANPAIHMNPSKIEGNGRAWAEFSPNGSALLGYDSWSVPGDFYAWDTATGRRLATFVHDDRKTKDENVYLRGAAFAGNDAVLSWSRTVREWDLSAMIEVPIGFQVSEPHEITDLCHSTDRTKMLLRFTNGAVRLINCANGTMLLEMMGIASQPMPYKHSSRLRQLGDRINLSPDASRLALKEPDGAWRILDAESGKEITRLDGPGDWLGSLVFSATNERVATVGVDATARLWDASSGVMLAAVRGWDGDTSWDWWPRFSPDGRTVLTNGGTFVHLWNASDGTHIAELRGHYRTVTDALFTPDGSRIATCSRDGTVRMWDAITGAGLGVLLRERGIVNEGGFWSLAFSPDGTRLAVCSYDGPIYVFDTSPSCERQACR